jgi:glycosyltransferase involved in cell wall biosynthesis
MANESFMLGYVGRFVPEKGIDDLISALAMLPEHYRLTLVGAGSDEHRLRQHAQTAGVADRISWCTPIATTDMPAMMRSFDLLVLPSRTTANWKEQFGRVLIEAMACGVPPVGSDSGEIPHVIGNGGRTFPEGDAAALARCVSDICSQPTYHAELRVRARQRILDCYTQQALAAQYVAIYHQMHAHISARTQSTSRQNERS